MEYAELPDCIELDSLESVQVLSSPQRLSLIEALVEPRSASELAELQRVPVTRLYYHLDALLNQGFIRVVEKRPAGRIPERVFQVAGKSFRLSEQFLKRYGTDGTIAAIALSFRHAEAALTAAIRAGTVSLDPEDGDAPSAHITLAMLRLAPSKLRELVHRLEELQEEFAGDDDNATPVNFFVAVHPRAYSR